VYIGTKIFFPIKKIRLKNIHSNGCLLLLFRRFLVLLLFRVPVPLSSQLKIRLKKHTLIRMSSASVQPPCSASVPPPCSAPVPCPSTTFFPIKNPIKKTYTQTDVFCFRPAALFYSCSVSQYHLIFLITKMMAIRAP
jgi:hypothetical protein